MTSFRLDGRVLRGRSQNVIKVDEFLLCGLAWETAL